MAFIQIVEYETDRADELQALMDEAEERGDGSYSYQLTQDHDRPNHYMMIVEFPSYEAAMANSARPETDRLAKQMSTMTTSGPRYHNLDVRASGP